MKWICCLMLGALALSTTLTTRAESLTLLSRAGDTEVELTLSAQQRQWLKEKATLRVGVYLPDRPPLDMTVNQNDYEGLCADYLDILARTLGVRLQIEHFATQQQALTALRNADIDLVPRINHLPALYDDLGLSAPYAYDQAVLISRPGTLGPHNALPPGTTVLFDPDWITRERVASLFPDTPLKPVPSTQNGLGQVAYGAGMVLLTDAISAQYQLERNYQQSLKQTIQRDSEGLGFSFALRRNDAQLSNLINSVLANITPQERVVIARHWGIGANPKLGYTRLQLTAAEQQWIKDHPQIDLLVNDLYPPFSFFNEQGQLRGMATDLLDMINDRTGLTFQPSKFTSVDAMTSRTQRDPVSLIGALTFSDQREQDLAFSRPFGINPFALVTRVQPEHPGLSGLNGKRVAIVKGSAAASWLAREWPQIQIEAVDTPIETYELLAEGRVDGVVQPQLGATYLINRFFRGRLQIDSVIGSQPALIGFATGRQNALLISIIDKALLDIPPEVLTNLVNRWQNPQESQGGWNAYKTWFYRTMLGLMAVLAVILAWNVGLRRQITERLKAQKALNDQLVFMKVLVDGTPNPIYVRDRQGLLLTCNRAYLQVMDVELEQVLNKGLIEADILPLEDAQSYKRIHRATLDSGEPSFSNFTMAVKGKPYHIHHWALPYRDSDGSMTGVIGGWIDLTEQQNLQHALHQAKDQAEAASQGKSHFLAVMSHEIRTPMSALIGVLELLQDKCSDPPLLDIAQKSAGGMMELIGEILDLAKIESGKFELRTGICYPERLINTVIQSFASLARQKNVALEFVHTGNDIAVALDSLRFRQIVSNLISNAIKFTTQGTVTVELALESDRDCLQLHLRVRDTGIGMDEQQRSRLFEPYTQFASNHSDMQVGTGLGLAICRQLTELMGGRLSCTSTPGQGSCFALDMSVTEVADDETTPTAHTGVTVALPVRRILIVEDHEFNRVVLQRQLESLGMLVTCAEDGMTGLRRYEDQVFDYVITDCNMPRMNGEEMTRQLREFEGRDARPATHVVGLTANAQPQEIQRCIEAGMNDCLFKPVTRNELERYLANVESNRNTSPACFDIAKVWDITAGDAAMTRQLLATVLRTNQEDLEALQARYDAGDLEAAGRCCHKILGSARIIQAMPLINACEQLEQACQQAVPADELNRLFDTFILHMHHLQNSIRASLHS
ncbi:ATP-binding protein [Pseudomonas sp. NPDC089569]|uniref:ATP-binding protein n=1 Tax=Pseudomonas sp. NPDC089569 TaxID=3390722 RepID=UPI003CFE0C5A